MACSWLWRAPATNIIAPAISPPQVGNCYLIQFDKMEESEAPPLPPMELYTLEELSWGTIDWSGQNLVSTRPSTGDACAVRYAVVEHRATGSAQCR